MDSQVSKFGWAGKLTTFTSTSLESWLSSLENQHKQSMNEKPSESQVKAWIDSFQDLQTVFSSLTQRNPESGSWTVVFEYELPREKGRRPDLILLSPNDVFVVEFKNYGYPVQSHIDQVESYVRDLKLYHNESHVVEVHPILVLRKLRENPLRVMDVDICNSSSLSDIIQRLVSKSEGSTLDPKKWIDAEYDPLPSLVGAARSIFHHEKLPRIKRAESAGIPETLQELSQISKRANKGSELHLVLVTGVPGSGKTLVGLQFVYENFTNTTETSSVLLSGNGPLIEVLQHALRSKVFVQDVHGFLKEYGGGSSLLPKEHTWVYDEAQRAWDENRAKERRGINASSEPMEFLSLAERMSGGITVVALVGEGQEIHVGEEAGIGQWASVLSQMKKDWIVHIPPKLSSVFGAFRIEICPNLDLTTSLRSHIAGDVAEWVSLLLRGESEKCEKLSGTIIGQGFELYASRSLDDCKRYLRERYEGEEEKRYGLLASSKAKNLTEYCILNDFNSTQAVQKGPWYNDSPTSKKSCCQLKQVMTEFGCQGLELDTPLVCWGDDLVWREGHWVSRVSSRSGAIDPHRLRLNSYRVLLTRGRDGLIVYVPPSEELDATFNLLLSSGMRKLESRKGPILVTAALISLGDKILITKRRKDDSGKWEFPGGKVEYGESPEVCLVREIKEELDCDIGVERLVHSSSIVYPNGTHYVILFYQCSLIRGTPQNIVHESFEWVSKEDLKHFDFSRGDREAIETLY